MRNFRELIRDVLNEQDLEKVNDLKQLLLVINDAEKETIEDGEEIEGFVDFGLELLYNISDSLDDETIDYVISELKDFYFDEEDLEGEDESEDEEDMEGEDESEDEEYFESLMEAQKTMKQHKLAQIRREKLKQLGNKAKSINFKRNYYFDTKLRKFVKRDKPLSLQTLKKKALTFKKVLKKSSTKKAALRTKKKFGEV